MLRNIKEHNRHIVLYQFCILANLLTKLLRAVSDISRTTDTLLYAETPRSCGKPYTCAFPAICDYCVLRYSCPYPGSSLSTGAFFPTCPTSPCLGLTAPTSPT